MKKLTSEILISFVSLIILIIFIYGLGIYKYGWSRYGVKTVVKIVPYPAAFVDSLWIPLSKFENQKSLILHFYQSTSAPLEDEAALNRQIMDSLIEQKLVEREFQKRKLLISQKEIEERYQKFVEENKGEEEVKKKLEDLYGISTEDFNQRKTNFGKV